MNTLARLNCIALCTLIALAAPTALLPAEPLVRAESTLPVPAGMDANDPNRFSVSGVVFMTGTPVALMTDTARSMSWFVWGKHPVDRYSIREITREQVVLVEHDSGRELRLSVAAAAPGGPVPFTKEWINSTANPMLHYIVSPPDELYKDWPNATDADKKEIADFYEKYGWKLVSAENIRGLVDFVWERSNIDELIAAAKAQREVFANLLSPEQLQVWQQIRAYQSVYAVNGKYTDEQRQFIADRGRVITGFQATLSAEQKAAYDDIRAHPVPAAARTTEKPNYALPRLSAEATGTGPAPYSKAWINSPANPMLHRPPSLPGDLRDNWAALTTAEKAQVVEFYQKHGWQILLMETVSGVANDSSWRNIYEKERTAVLKAKREAFLSLLSPEQRQAWKNGPFGQTIYIKDGNPDYARNRNGPEQQKYFDPFWASLDTRQRAAYEDMHDFTRADWN